MWVAAEWRKPCGESSGAPGTARVASCTMRRTCRTSRRPPRTPSSRAGPERAVATSGRPSASQASSARAAGAPYGTRRIRPPLPTTVASRASRSTSSMSRLTSSATRRPVAYRSSRTAASRRATADCVVAGTCGWSVVCSVCWISPTCAAASTDTACSCCSTAGRRAGRLGERRRVEGSALIRPVRRQWAKKRRTAAMRRAMVAGAAPVRDIPRTQARRFPASMSGNGSPRPSGSSCCASRRQTSVR